MKNKVCLHWRCLWKITSRQIISPPLTVISVFTSFVFFVQTPTNWINDFLKFPRFPGWKQTQNIFFHLLFSHFTTELLQLSKRNKFDLFSNTKVDKNSKNARHWQQPKLKADLDFRFQKQIRIKLCFCVFIKHTSLIWNRKSKMALTDLAPGLGSLGRVTIVTTSSIHTACCIEARGAKGNASIYGCCCSQFRQMTLPL